MTKEQLADYLKDGGVDLDNYLQELDAVRRQGYAISKEELIRGAVSIAAPFFDKPGHLAGAIVVFGPSARVGEPQVREISALLVKESRALTKLLCGSP